MKRLQIIIVLILSLTLVNCGDELTEDPKHFLVKENFYRNESDAFSALTAVYSTLGQDGGFPTIWYMAMLENRADYSNGRGSQSPMSVYDLPLDNSNQSRMFDAYADIYRGINRANAVLDNVPGIDMDESLKKRYLAEARFLRAYFTATW